MYKIGVVKGKPHTVLNKLGVLESWKENALHKISQFPTQGKCCTRTETHKQTLMSGYSLAVFPGLFLQEERV